MRPNLKWYWIAVVLVIAACKKNNTQTNGAGNPSIQTVSPAGGHYGTIDTIVGTNFGNDTSKIAVKFNGTQGVITSASNDTLIVIVPEDAEPGPVTVTVNGLTGTGPNFNYIYTVVVSTVVGDGISGYATGLAANSEVGYVFGMGLDKAGNLYYTDQGALIAKLSTDSIVSTYAGTGVAGYKDGPANTAQFNGTDGIG